MRITSAFLLVVLVSHSLFAGYGDQSAAVAERSRIVDQLVQKHWQEHSVKPSEHVHDQIFMRRIFLDVTGSIPTGKEALNFVNSKLPNKRQVLIDYLLTTEGYVSHNFNYWADVLRIKSRINQIEFHNYVKWVKEALRQNMPYDQFVREMVTATGRISENGAAGYYLRDQGMPLDNTANTASIFLGTSIGCAQCHDHPFDHWTQEEFYRFAAFTHEINPRGVMMTANRKSMFQKRKAVEAETERRKLSPQERQAIRQIVQRNVWMVKDDPRRKLRFPKDYQYDDKLVGKPATPKVIYGENAKLQSDENKREALADWMVSAKNPFFAKNIANRVWKKIFGVALIEPVDSIEGKEASNPELLDFLAREMVRLKFNLKEFQRILFNTDLYARRAVYREVNELAYRFPGPTLRRMTAEQLWDSLVALTMDDPYAGKYEDVNPTRYPQVDLVSASPKEVVDIGLTYYKNRAEKQKQFRQKMKRMSKQGPNLNRASEMSQPAPITHFLADFGQADRNLIEGGNTDPTITQVLTMLNGRHHYQIIREGSILSEHLNKIKDNKDYRVRVIYLSILGREPTDNEHRLALNLFEEEKMLYKGNRALVWILLNTPEFMFIQ